MSKPTSKLYAFQLTKRIAGLAVLALLIFQVTSCGRPTYEPGPKPSWQSNDDPIVAERTAFWHEWEVKVFPDKDWSKSTFITAGLDTNAFKIDHVALTAEMSTLYDTPADAAKYLQGVINSGSSVPTSLYLNQGDSLFKIVPKGNAIIGSYSVYYMTGSDLNLVKENQEYLEQKLGLPVGSCSAEYDVFAIISQADSNIVYQSTIAPATQYANATPDLIYSAPGSWTQTLIINNAKATKWTKTATKLESINPQVLPKLD